MWRFIKIIFLFIILFFIILVMRFDHRFNNNYKIINNGEVFATYIDGNVYIGDNVFAISDWFMKSVDMNTYKEVWKVELN